MAKNPLEYDPGLNEKERMQSAFKRKTVAKKMTRKHSWSTGKTECNMCNKTTPHTHFK